MKKTILIACIVALVTLTAGPAFGQIEIDGCSYLIDALPTDVLMKVIYADLESVSYFQEVTIQNPCPELPLPAPTVIDGIHKGWCLDPDTGITNGNRYLGYPYASHLPLPASLTSLWPTAGNLPMVIWLLNNTHLIGTPSNCPPDLYWGGVNFTYGDFQNAMWGLLEGGTIFAPGDSGTSVLGPFDVCRTVELMEMAMLHPNFVPGCGDYIGIILDVYYVGACPDLADDPLQRQPVLIPLLCICEGCTPGFWKNNADKKEANAWEVYSPGDDFSDVFGIPEQVLRDKGKALFTNPTLLEALNANGDGIDQLARHATAALLNITSGCVDDAIGSEAELKQMVQDAIAAGPEAIQALADELVGFNEAGCPIDQKTGECDD